jgi:hypothetical protein
LLSGRSNREGSDRRLAIYESTNLRIDECIDSIEPSNP